jgi:hypothetical protein
MPKVVSIVRADANPTGATTVNFTVTFNEAVTGVTAANFAIAGTGSTGATVGTPTGSGTTWTVPVTVGTATGVVGLNMASSTGVKNGGDSALGNVPFTTGETYTIAPKVVSINRAGTSPSSGSTVSWTVTFNESVTGVKASNFNLTGGTGTSVTSVTGSGTTWTVTANTGTTTGTLGLEMANGTSTADSNGAAVINVPFTTGQTYSIAPRVVSITRGTPIPVTGTSVTFNVTFNEDVTGVTAANFGLTAGTLGTAAITNVSGSGKNWTVKVNLGTSSGSLGLSMLNSTGAVDSDSNPVGNLPFTTGEIYSLAPMVISMVRSAGSINPTSSETLAWTVTFSIPVSGLTPANFSAIGGGTVTGVTGADKIWTVQTSPGTATSTVGLTMVNSTGVANSTGMAVANVPYSTEERYTIAPRILSVDQMSSNPVVVTSTSTPPNTASVVYLIRFNESVTGVTTANFELTGTSAADSSVQSVTGSGKEWSVTVRVGGTGMVALKMKDSAGVTDSDDLAVGNVPYTTKYYQVAPRVTAITRASPNPATTPMVNYTVTFSESVTGVTAANFGLVTTGVAGAVINGVTGSGTTWTVMVALGASTGSVTLQHVNSTGLTDSDGVAVGAASMPFKGETYLVAPRVLSINRAGGPTTSELFTDFVVTFSESVTGVTASNFTVASTLVALTGSSTVTIGSITGTGATRTVRLILPEGKGTVGLNMTSTTGVKDADSLPVANIPLTGQTVSVIAVRITNTGGTKPPTPPKRPGMNARDNNIARMSERLDGRMANGDLVYMTATLENTSGPAQEMWLRAPIPEGYRAIPWPYFPDGARDIPWGYFCDRGDCMVKSPRSDQEVLTTPGMTTRQDNSVNRVSEAAGTKAKTATTDMLYPELFNEQELVWHGMLDVGEMVTIYYAVQISNQEPHDTSMSIPAYVALSYDDAVPGMHMKMLNGSAMTTAYVPTAPGGLALGLSPAGGQKLGSVLVYPLYTSSVNTTRQDSRFTLTNTSPDQTGYVHLFFVDGSDCSVADRFVTLTPNQTTSFTASDLDPLVSGYLIAVAVDEGGCPKYFNHLIGEVFVKFESGHKASLPAVAIAALSGGLAPCYASDATAELAFDGISYNELPRTIAISNIAPRAEGNDTMLVVNRIGGDMAATGGLVLGPLAGILYDDLERSASFTMAGQACQMRTTLTGSSLRTTPRFENMIPSGRSGWLKIAAAGDEGIIGAVLNSNPNGFTQGHVLHTLTVTRTAVLTIPVAPPE